jgi:hypothetical protein
LFNFWELSPSIVVLWKKTITIVGSLPLFPFLFPLLRFAGFESGVLQPKIVVQWYYFTATTFAA